MAVERVQANSPLKVPEVCQRVWTAFWEIDGTRSTMAGLAVIYQPIKPGDILAHQELSRIALDNWERRAILRMDRVRLAFLNEAKEGEGSAPPDTVSERPMSGALFDALF